MAALKKKKIKKAAPKKKVVKKPIKKTVARPTKAKTGKKIKKTVVRKIVRKAAVKKIPLVSKKTPSLIKKFQGNPIIEPVANSFWEGEAVLNPAAVVHNGRIHLFYRAMGGDGMSRIGYISSKDGFHFEDRLPFPVYTAENVEAAKSHHPYTSPARLVYNTDLYSSGGGWGGCEDPRAVKIDGRIYMTFNMFNGWNSMRVGFTSISEHDLTYKNWNWSPFAYLSRPGDRQKNWVLFPEKINGKFALFYNLDKGDPSRVHIAYLDELDMNQTPSATEAPDPHVLPDHVVAWHHRTRSAAAPPIKTADGWLLFYHAMDKNDPDRYKVGAMLLDLKDPTKVLYRSSTPLLAPDEWYENDWKPGIVYASGAVIKDGTLFLYYGGGDKRIAVASANLKEFIQQLKNNKPTIFSKKSVKKI